MDFTRADVAHLLRRAGFGGSAAEIDALMNRASWADVVDRVLDTSAAPPDAIPEAVEDREDEWYPPWVASVHHWMDRMATSPTPIVEKMTLFWHGVFVSSVDKMKPRLVFKQIKTYRELALGDLHELAQAMAKTPAMLIYLDNESNVVGNPNENFARELMELFLLGQGHYTEADVVDMARAWTGHGYDSVGETYIWYPGRHDNGQKTIWGITRAWDGPETITEMVRGSKQRACARFIATKLWAFLAGPAPGAEVIDALADAFISADMEIKALVRAIFLRPEFRSPAVKTGLLRSPVEWMAATMKVLGLPASVAHPEWYAERAGQYLYAPPNVGGWRGNEGWIATSTAWGRGSFASHCQWMARDRGIFAGADRMTFDRFGIADPSPATRAAVEAYVRGEQAARRGWAIQPSLVVLMMMSPDFQAA
jgi:uncharacterized protein (DUF1800 family)